MNEMVQRVREACHRFYFDGPFGDAPENYYLVKDRSGQKGPARFYSYDVAKSTSELANARAAIEVMRKPNNTMLACGDDLFFDADGEPLSIDVWQAMIDAALSEDTE